MIRTQAEPEPERRSVLDFSAFSDLMSPVAAGVEVTQSTAVNLPAVYKCIALNSETISSLPLDCFTKRGGDRVPYPEPTWFQNPNQYQTMREFLAMTQVSLDIDGNAFWLRGSDSMGRLQALYIVAPSAVQVQRVDGQTVYIIRAADGTQSTYAANSVVHLRGMTMPGELRGLSPIGCAKQTIGIGLAAEQFGGQFFGNGANMSGLITTTAALTQEQVELIKAQMARRHGGIQNSHAIGVLAGGAQWTPMSVKPEEAQFLETRKYTNDEIGQLFGYPAGFFDTDGAKGYVSALSRMLRLWYLTGIMPRLVRLEEALSGLLPRGAYVKFNRNALLQMDPAERTAYYQAGQAGEWLAPDQIRALEDMNPLGGEYAMPLKSVQWVHESDPPPDGEDTTDDEAAE